MDTTKKKAIREDQEAVLLDEKIQMLFLQFDQVLEEIEFEEQEEAGEAPQQSLEYY